MEYNKVKFFLGGQRMKKFILGALMFSWGMVGVITLTIIIALNPWNYNGIDGIKGALLGMGVSVPYIIFWMLTLVGIFLCVIDIYLDNKKHNSGM